MENIIWMMRRMRCSVANKNPRCGVEGQLGWNVLIIHGPKLLEQGGHDRFTSSEEDDLVDAELVAKLVKDRKRLRMQRCHPRKWCRWHENGLQRLDAVKM